MVVNVFIVGTRPLIWRTLTLRQTWTIGHCFTMVLLLDLRSQALHRLSVLWLTII